LMSFTTKSLIMGSNVVEWQLILIVLDNEITTYNVIVKTLYAHYHCSNYDR
jgi:hypothetical protein